MGLLAWLRRHDLGLLPATDTHLAPKSTRKKTTSMGSIWGRRCKAISTGKSASRPSSSRVSKMMWTSPRSPWTISALWVNGCMDAPRVDTGTCPNMRACARCTPSSTSLRRRCCSTAATPSAKKPKNCCAARSAPCLIRFSWNWCGFTPRRDRIDHSRAIDCKRPSKKGGCARELPILPAKSAPCVRYSRHSPTR